MQRRAVDQERDAAQEQLRCPLAAHVIGPAKTSRERGKERAANVLLRKYVLEVGIVGQDREAGGFLRPPNDRAVGLDQEFGEKVAESAGQVAEVLVLDDLHLQISTNAVLGPARGMLLPSGGQPGKDDGEGALEHRREVRIEVGRRTALDVAREELVHVQAQVAQGEVLGVGELKGEQSELRAESTRAKSTKQRAKSKEQKAESGEQKAEAREQRPESRELRAVRIDQG
jgi:hypothetical protein